MSAGLYVYNQNNYLILAEEYENYTLAQSGYLTTIPAASWWVVDPAYAVQFPSSWGGEFLIAVGGVPSGYTVALGVCQKDLYTSGYYSFFVIARVVGSLTSQSLSIPYRVYRRMSGVAASTDNFGLRVRNASNALVFDSGHSFLSVTGIAYSALNSLGDSAAVYGLSNPFVLLNSSTLPVMSTSGAGWTYGFEIQPSYVVMRPHATHSVAPNLPNTYGIGRFLVTIR